MLPLIDFSGDIVGRIKKVHGPVPAPEPYFAHVWSTSTATLSKTLMTMIS